MNPAIQKKARTLPRKPGVYLFKNSAGEVIYVGKAKNLQHRVSSYFQPSRALAPDKEIMVGRVVELETIVVSSELEALLLEGSLIKKYHPHYNIILRDDKYFTFIKISLRDRFPQIELVRRLTKDGSKYFGPFTSAWRVRQTLKLMKKIFRYCAEVPPGGPTPKTKPCFDFELGRCLGACAGSVTSEQYHQLMRRIIGFLEGRTDDILKQLKTDMSAAAQDQAFERAASLRDQLQSVERVTARQQMISVKRDNIDVVSLARDSGTAAVNLFRVRSGKLLEKDVLLLQHAGTAPETEIITSFLEQYYGQATDRPQHVILGQRPESVNRLERLLNIRVVVPNRGRLKQLVSLGEENAQQELTVQRARWESDQDKAGRSLSALGTALKLSPPARIECYDISNIQGTHAVGSMVVFEKGLPKKSAYRKFTIKGVRGSNDVAMMAEVMRRRLRHTEVAGWIRPDLIIVDGGKGQLSAVQSVLRETGVKIPLIALAKREEEIFKPDKLRPLVLEKSSEALFLIQRIRDEAHRFAIGAFHAKQRRSAVTSRLDEITGIGPKTKQALLRKFGSVEGIRRAPEQDIVAAIGSEKAEKIFENLG